MARVTVEDCLARVPNRFALTILASRRARALSESRGRPLVECDNKEGVTALREVSSDRIRFKEDVESTMREFIEEQRRQLRVTTGEHTFLEAASLRALDDTDDEEVEDESEDVEELQSDPEALNKQAKGSSDGEDEDEDEDEEEEESEEEESFEGDAIDDDSIPDDSDAPPDIGDDDDSDDDDDDDDSDDDDSD